VIVTTIELMGAGLKGLLSPALSSKGGEGGLLNGVWRKSRQVVSSHGVRFRVQEFYFLALSGFTRLDWA